MPTSLKMQSRIRTARIFLNLAWNIVTAGWIGGAEGYAQGAINFGTNSINAPGITGVNALEDFLVGYPSSGQIPSREILRRLTVQSFTPPFLHKTTGAPRVT